LHLVGILFPHINDDARSKSHQINIEEPTRCNNNNLLGSKVIIVASSWFFCITLPTLMMHGQTQTKLYIILALQPKYQYLLNTPF